MASNINLCRSECIQQPWIGMKTSNEKNFLNIDIVYNSYTNVVLDIWIKLTYLLLMLNIK